jgi:hypothetical protein
MVLLLKIVFVWDMKQCLLVICYRRFGGVCLPRLPVSRPTLKLQAATSSEEQVTSTNQYGLVSHKFFIFPCVAWHLGSGLTVNNS